MSISLRKNIGAYIKAVFTGDLTNLTAAGSGDNTLVNGATVDLQANGYPMSAVLAFAVKSTLVNTKTLTLSGALQTTADATNGPWTNVANFAPTVVLTGITAGTAQSATQSLSVDLNGAKRYVRAQYLPLASATGTDTANIMAVLILGGQPELPA